MRKIILFLVFCFSVLCTSAQRISHHFDDVTLSDALRSINQMQNNYRVNFLYNELEDFRVTTTIHKLATPDAILQLIGFYPVKMTMGDDGEIFVECTHKTEKHITGKIIDQHHEPVPYANIALLNPTDSVLIGGGVSNESGVFVIPYEQPSVLVRITYVGYKTAFRFAAKEDVGTIQLEPDRYHLEGVTITAKRIKYSTDGYRAMIASEKMYQSRNLFDAMLTLPGIFVDQDQVKAYGNSITAVYVDDKKLTLNDSELKPYLTSLQAKGVISVELKNPDPTRELIDGDGYVLRIKTVSGRGGGMATLRMAANNGNCNDIDVNPSVNILQTFGKFSYTAYVNYKPKYRLSRETNTHSDYLTTGDVRDENQKSVIQNKHDTYYLLGFGYVFNDNHSVALNLNGKYFQNTANNHTQNVFRASQTTGNTRQHLRENTVQASLEYNGTIERVSYAAILFAAHQAHRRENLREQIADDAVSEINVHRLTHNNVWGATALSAWTINKQQTLYLSSSFSNWNNYIDRREQAFQNPETYAHYRYQEQNWKVNVDFRQKFGNLTLLASVRWNAIRTNYPEMPACDRNESYFLPNATAKYVFNSNKGHYAELSYRKFVSMPAFSEQTPDTTWTSEYLRESGNPYIEPTTLHRLTLRIKFYDFVLKTLYQKKKSSFIAFEADPTGVVSMEIQNGKIWHDLETTLYAPTIKPCKGWMINPNVSYIFEHESFAQRTNCWHRMMVGLTSMNELPCKFNLMVNLQLGTNRRSLVSKSEGTCSLYASLSRSFLKSRLNTSLTASYLKTHWSENFSETYFSTSRFTKSLYKISLNLSYMFSWGKNIRRVKNSSNDELDRL